MLIIVAIEARIDRCFANIHRVRVVACGAIKLGVGMDGVLFQWDSATGGFHSGKSSGESHPVSSLEKSGDFLLMTLAAAFVSHGIAPS